MFPTTVSTDTDTDIDNLHHQALRAHDAMIHAWADHHTNPEQEHPA